MVWAWRPGDEAGPATMPEEVGIVAGRPTDGSRRTDSAIPTSLPQVSIYFNQVS
jgi:hypothetical protein